jgi:hypothetical protein
MGSEQPSVPGLLSDLEPTGRPPIDPVRASVQIALVLYLMPVILLVAALGVTSIVVARMARGVARAAAWLKFDPRPESRPEQRAIGFRPIAGRKRARLPVGNRRASSERTQRSQS